MDVQYENRSITLYAGPKKKIEYSTHIRCLKWNWLAKTVWISPANNYLFEVNNRNTRKMCEICSKLTIKWRCSSVFTFNFVFTADFQPVKNCLEKQKVSWIFLWKNPMPVEPKIVMEGAINADLQKINLSMEIAGERSK